MSYVFTEMDVRRAHSAAAQAKRRETFAHNTRLRRDDVRRLRERGMVPLAIADALLLADATTAHYLRDLERAGELEPTPPYLSLAWRDTKSEVSRPSPGALARPPDFIRGAADMEGGAHVDPRRPGPSIGKKLDGPPTSSRIPTNPIGHWSGVGWASWRPGGASRRASLSRKWSASLTSSCPSSEVLFGES
jgi:hypothetical protein